MIGSLNSIQATAEKLSIPQLQQAMRDGTLPPYVGVPLLQKKVQMQKQMQMASQSQQPKKPSIAEQVNQEATADEMMRQRARMMQAEMGQTGGISDFLPKGEESYAKGGPIAFAEKGYVDPEFVGEWNPPSESEFYAMEQQRKLREKNRSMFDAMQANDASQYRYLPSPEGKTWDQFNEALGASNYEALPYHIPSREMAAAEDNYMSLGKSNLQAVNANAITSRLLADPKVAESQFGFSKPNEYGLFPDIERLRKLPSAKDNDPEANFMAAYNRQKENEAKAMRESYLKDQARRLVAAERARPFPELPKKPEPAVQAPYAPGQTPVSPNTPPPVVDRAVASGARLNTPPVAGSVAPAVQTPYAQAVQAAPVEQAPAPQVAPETILSAAERAKQFKEALGEDVGRADTMKRLAEREAATAKQEERAPWLGLMQAGLATMAGTSPFAMANIGAGGVAGLNAYMKAQDKLDTAKENHDAILAQLNKAQRAEDVAAYKFGADSEQADKALAAREKLQDKELASREKMNREDNAVREKVAGMQVAGSIERAGLIHSGAGGIDNQSRADRLQNARLNSMLNATKASIANMRSGAKANGTLDLLEKDPEYIALLNDLKSIQNTLKAKAIPNASPAVSEATQTPTIPKSGTTSSGNTYRVLED